MCGIANHDIAAGLSKLVGEPLHLVHAVQLVVYGHDERERCAECRNNGGQVDLVEVIEKQIGRSGAAIDNNQVRLLHRSENAIEFAAIVEVEEKRFGMEPLQGRILVVAVDGDMGHAFVLEELDEIHSEETLTNASFAVE